MASRKRCQAAEDGVINVKGSPLQSVPHAVMMMFKMMMIVMVIVVVVVEVVV